MEKYPFKVMVRRVPLKMNEVYSRIKEMVGETSGLHSHNGYEFIIEMVDKTPLPKTIFYIKIVSKQSGNVSQLDNIIQYLKSHPKETTSCLLQPGGTQMPYEREVKGKLHEGVLRVVFSGFSLSALDQEASVRILKYASILVERVADELYNFDDIVLLTDPFCAYIMYSLGFEEEPVDDYGSYLDINCNEGDI